MYDKNIHLFGAIWDDEIIGVVIVYNYSQGCCIISRLQVNLLFQGRGIGHILLTTATNYCKNNNINLIRCVIDDETCDVQKFSKLLQQLGWHNLGIDHNYCKLQIENYKNSFFGRHADIKNLNGKTNITIKLMSKTSEVELRTLNQYINTVPYSLRPIDSSNINLDLSFYLIKNGDIIGWLCTTQKDKDEICVENIYIKNEYRINGYGIFLMDTLARILLTDKSYHFKYISYYTNNSDTSIKKMYDLLFGESIEKQVNYYNFEKII